MNHSYHVVLLVPECFSDFRSMPEVHILLLPSNTWSLADPDPVDSELVGSIPCYEHHLKNIDFSPPLWATPPLTELPGQPLWPTRYELRRAHGDYLEHGENDVLEIMDFHIKSILELHYKNIDLSPPLWTTPPHTELPERPF